MNMRMIYKKHVHNNPITSYIDETYVLITGSTKEQLFDNVTACLETHLSYLSKQGMVTNFSKSEGIIFSRTNETWRCPITASSKTFIAG